MTNYGARFGVLLAAHGARREGATNASIKALASELASHDGVAEIRVGFINSAPTIAQAVSDFAASEVRVYPLFMSDGYFARVRLPQLVAEAQRQAPRRRISILPALGLDPRLAELIAGKAAAAAGRSRLPEDEVSVVLLAHGSCRDGASRRATHELARRINGMARFAAVSCAFLDEPPTLADCIRETAGPVIVIGLFVGDGLHAGEDAPALMAGLGSNVMFGGSVGEWPEIAEIAIAAICR